MSRKAQKEDVTSACVSLSVPGDASLSYSMLRCKRYMKLLLYYCYSSDISTPFTCMQLFSSIYFYIFLCNDSWCVAGWDLSRRLFDYCLHATVRSSYTAYFWSHDLLNSIHAGVSVLYTQLTQIKINYSSNLQLTFSKTLTNKTLWHFAEHR